MFIGCHPSTRRSYTAVGRSRRQGRSGKAWYSFQAHRFWISSRIYSPSVTGSVSPIIRSKILCRRIFQLQLMFSSRRGYSLVKDGIGTRKRPANGSQWVRGFIASNFCNRTSTFWGVYRTSRLWSVGNLISQRVCKSVSSAHLCIWTVFNSMQMQGL